VQDIDTPEDWFARSWFIELCLRRRRLYEQNHRYFGCSPDDEVLGVGGMIARHAAMGDKVHIIIAAEGATSRDAVRHVQSRQTELAELQSAARKAVSILGGMSVRFLVFQTTAVTAWIALI